MKKISRTQAREEIEEFFKDIKSKTPKEIKKVKKLSMRHNLPLKEKRKLFCGKCFSPYKNAKIRVKNKKKIVTCLECGNVYSYLVDTEEQAREHAHLITNTGYRSFKEGQLTFYPVHRIMKVKCIGDLNSKYPDDVEGT